MKASDLTANEYAEYYANYINLVGDSDLQGVLAESSKAINELFQDVSEERMNFKYADGKWTIKEMLLHIIDTERVFAYRALRFARQDATNLPGFEHNDYVTVSKANNRDKASLLNEFNAQRNSTLMLFSNFDDETLLQIGNASDNPMSVRALGFMIAGHQLHHCNVLRERYLNR